MGALANFDAFDGVTTAIVDEPWGFVTLSKDDDKYVLTYKFRTIFPTSESSQQFLKYYLETSCCYWAYIVTNVSEYNFEWIYNQDLPNNKHRLLNDKEYRAECLNKGSIMLARYEEVCISKTHIVDIRKMKWSCHIDKNHCIYVANNELARLRRYFEKINAAATLSASVNVAAAAVGAATAVGAAVATAASKVM